MNLSDTHVIISVPKRLSLNPIEVSRRVPRTGEGEFSAVEFTLCWSSSLPVMIIASSSQFSSAFSSNTYVIDDAFSLIWNPFACIQMHYLSRLAL